MSISPRTAAFVATGSLLVAVLGVGARLPVPYVVITPGDGQNILATVDGERIIEVTGHPTYPTAGALDLTAIRVTRPETSLSLGYAFRAWLDRDFAIVPRELYYRDGETDEQQREENAQLMSQSQEDAKAAALREAGFDVPAAVVVAAVRKDSPADGKLEAADVLLSVDGRPVAGTPDLGAAIRDRTVGDPVTLGIERDGQPMQVTLDTVAAPDGSGRASIGVVAGLGYDPPFPVTINLSDRIGGPSGGLVMALGVYDTITPGPLTGGRHVAGTGTIDGTGEVGGIGGIRQKIVAARDAGAALFLAPRDNCAEVVLADPGDLQVVPVASLAEAVDALELAAGGDALPRCPGPSS